MALEVPPTPEASPIALTPRRREALRSISGVAIASGMGFLVAIGAGVILVRFGSDWGAFTYSLFSVGAGLWLSEHHPMGGAMLASSGIAAGAALLISRATSFLRVAAAGVVQPYQPPRHPFAPNIGLLAEEALGLVAEEAHGLAHGLTHGHAHAP